MEVENGDIVQLYPGESPKIIDKAPTGRMYVDGTISVGEESQSIKDRINLSYNGFLEITYCKRSWCNNKKTYNFL